MLILKLDTLEQAIHVPKQEDYGLINAQVHSGLFRTLNEQEKGRLEQMKIFHVEGDRTRLIRYK